MKRSITYFLFFALVCFAQNSYSQLQKGNILLGGSIGLGNSEYKILSSSPSNFGTQKTFSFNFNPEISYLLFERLSLGIVFPLSYSRTKFSDIDPTSKSTTYAVGPKLRYYFPFGNWAVFPEVHYTLGRQMHKFSNYSFTSGSLEDQKATTKTNNLKVGVGLAYFINRHVGIEGVFSYQKNEFDNEDFFGPDTETTSINFNIGLQVYLGKKEE